MKKALLILMVFCFQEAIPQGSKYALLVGESRYDSATGWVNLLAFKDLALVKSALLRQGFPEANIVCIRDHEATKAKIIEAFRRELTGKAQAGDIAFFYYSGHGQRMQDKNGDEPDGFDEAFVPVDAPKRYQKGIYEGERHLSDDEFQALLLPLRKKLGPSGSLVVAVDACYSGSITRGPVASVERGTKMVMASPDYRPAGGQVPAEPDGIAAAGRADGNELAGLVSFTACRDYETAFERQDTSGGVFTAAFTKSLLSSREGATYKDLFHRICVEMADDPRQNPTLEGKGNQLVFGNERLPENPAYLDCKNLSMYPGQQAPADSVTRLQLRISNPDFRARLRNAIGKVAFVRESGDSDAFSLSDSLQGNRLSCRLLNANGLCLLTDSFFSPPTEAVMKTFSDKLLGTLFNYLQARNLGMTTLNCRELQPELQLVPVSESSKDPYLFEARPDFAVGDTFVFRLKIKGPARRFAFYSILNISNGSSCALLRPAGNKSPEDYRIPLNEFVTLAAEKFVFSTPGKESFLLVCSDQPIDLRPQFAEPAFSGPTRGVHSGTFNPLTNALKSNPTRGISTPKVGVANVPVVVR